MASERALVRSHYTQQAFLGMLGLIITIFVVYPLIGKHVAIRVALDTALLVALVGMVYASGQPRHRALLFGGLALVAGTVNLLSYVDERAGVAFARIVAELLLMLMATFLLLISVLRNERVTAVKIYGAIAVYLLMGLTWGYVYDLLEFVQPGSFQAPALNMTEGYEPYLRRYEDSRDALYLSFVTLTTLGFGDVTPTTIAARALICLEAVAGQLYLAVLVARLVSLQITHAAAQPDEAAPGAAPPAEGPAAAASPALADEWRALLAVQQRQIELLQEQVQLLRGAPVGSAAPDGPAEPERGPVGPRYGPAGDA